MNIDWFKFLILLIVGLVVVGPEKLPSYARKAAKVIRNFEKVTKVITGQISEALDMDDDGSGKGPRFKQDLMAVKRTLEADVAELKSALESQAKAITETVEAGTRETTASFEQQAKEISETVNAEVTGLNTSLQEQAKVVAATIEAGMNPEPTAVQANAPVAEITQEPAQPAVEENLEASPQPVSPPAGEPRAG
jgi:sec-independent protein translocase protein TatB